MPIAPTISLAKDTGLPDLVTSDPSLTISDLPAGASRIVELRDATGLVVTTGATYVPPTQIGVYTVVVIDTDSSGTEHASLTFTYDNLAPLAAPTIGLKFDSSGGQRVTHTAQLEAKAGVDTGAKVQYLVVTGPPGAAQQGWVDSLSFSIEGTYQISARQMDGAGNTSPASAYFEFTLDTTAPARPTVALVDVPDGNNAIDTDGFVVTGGQDGDTVEYSLNKGTWTATAPDKLANGTYTVEVRIKDVAGNVSETSAPVTFTMEKPVPDGPTPSALVITNDGGASLTDGVMNEVPEFATLPGGLKLQFQIEGDWVDELTSAYFAEDGDYTIMVRIVDGNGSISEEASPVQFTLDRTVETLTVALTNGTQTNGETRVDGTPTFTFGNAEDRARQEFSTDGGTSWRAMSDLSNLRAGDYTVTFHQIDVAGNVSQGSNAVSFTIEAPDAATPATTGWDGGWDGGNDNGGSGLTGADFGW